MSEGSLTLPQEFPRVSLVPRSLFRVGNHLRKYQFFCPLRSSKRATFFFNLSRNIVAMQVETLWGGGGGRTATLVKTTKGYQMFEDFKLLVSKQKKKNNKKINK